MTKRLEKGPREAYGIDFLAKDAKLYSRKSQKKSGRYLQYLWSNKNDPKRLVYCNFEKRSALPILFKYALFIFLWPPLLWLQQWWFSSFKGLKHFSYFSKNPSSCVLLTASKSRSGFRRRGMGRQDFLDALPSPFSMYFRQRWMGDGEEGKVSRMISVHW